MALEIQIADFREQGVRLISPEDPEFEAIARARIGAEADLVLAQLMPYLVAVVNESTLAIVGLETVWSLEVEGHPGGTFSQLDYPEGVFKAGIGRLPIMPGDVRIVPAGDMVVENWPREANHVLQRFHEELRPERIAIQTVIFEDGRMLGSEGGSIAGFRWPSLEEHFRTSLEVRREWYARALRNLEEGRSEAEMLAEAEESLEKRKTVDFARRAMRGQHVFKAAREIRELMERGRETAVECLRLAVSRPQFELRRG